MINVLVLLAILLFVLMKLIGGEKGTRSFIALLFNFAILFCTILLLTLNQSPLLITFGACIFISCINLFYINGWSVKTISAFIATLLTLLFSLIFVFLASYHTHTQGFGMEEIEELGAFSLYVDINFIQIGICTIIMGMIGAITDTAMAIASAMNEVFLHNSDISRTKLIKSGMNIGKDILGTTTNTLFFAFLGSYLALIIWFTDLSYSFGRIINSKVFASEAISIFCIGISAVLIIPITAIIMAYYLTKKKKP